MKILPNTFTFSPKITSTCLILATIMIYCSTWQWERYKLKKELVATYAEDATTTDVPIFSGTDYSALLNRRVSVRGSLDLSRQLIVTNRKHATGPGHLLFAPLKINNSPHTIMVSRGFIPFADYRPDDWKKYNTGPEVSFDAVLKPTVDGSIFRPKNPQVGENIPYQVKWFFPEIAKMKRQLPYPILDDVYLQKLGGPKSGQFPAQSILIEVPPSTHYGYTIEWALLALGTMTIGLILQIIPRRGKLSGPPE